MDLVDCYEYLCGSLLYCGLMGPNIAKEPLYDKGVFMGRVMGEIRIFGELKIIYWLNFIVLTPPSPLRKSRIHPCSMSTNFRVRMF